MEEKSPTVMMILPCGCKVFSDGSKMLCPSCQRDPATHYYLCDARTLFGGKCGKAFMTLIPPTAYVCPECRS
ncbi:MAG: hypothetical protein WC551_11300 [Patescibacteria group bacterium]